MSLDLLPRMKEALGPYGLNLIGTAKVEAYEALVPPSYHVRPYLPQGKTLIVVGSGGGSFWQAFQAYLSAHPGYKERENPLDDYTLEVVEGSLTPLLTWARVDYRYLYPFRFAKEPVSFMHLALAAGLGGPSLLGVLIHPTFGPWMALRAAVLISLDLHEPPPALGFDPCPSCIEKPCRAACPAGAIRPEEGWDIPACVRHRLRVPFDCVDRCQARYECVYGREYRYPADELRYHHQKSFLWMKACFQEGGKT